MARNNANNCSVGTGFALADHLLVEAHRRRT